MVWALGLVAVLSASGGGQEAQAVARPAFLAAQAGLCMNTGGVWQAGWVHCVCPSHTLFAPDRGCGPVPLSRGARHVQEGTTLHPASLRRALRTLVVASRGGQGAQVLLDANALSDAALQGYASVLRADPAAVLRGFTLAPAWSQHAMVWILAPVAADTRQEVEREQPVGPAQVLSVDPFFAHPGATASAHPAALFALDPDWLDAAWWGEPGATQLRADRAARPAPRAAAGGGAWRCEQALAATAMPLTTVTQLCTSAQAAWRHLQDPAAIAWPLGPVAAGFRSDAPQCQGECSLAVQFLGADVAVYYSVVLADGVPVRRVLRAGSPLGHELMLFLSPSGSIDSVVAKTRHAPVRSDDPVLQRERWLFDRAWRLARHDADALGDQAQFDRALVGWLGRNQLLTDSAPRQGTATGVVIDTGVDPRLPGLRHRMQLPYGGTLLDQLAPLSGFAASTSSSLRTLTLFDERGHGTRVAARLLANLPGARLHVLHGDDLGFVPAPQLQAQWLQALRAVQPHVVNISQDFSRLLPDCESFFGPLVQALPDTLFIAGAGNDGAANAAGVCPAGLASRYANVLSVAGSNRYGTALDPLSNHGACVSVAAPMQQPTVAFGSSEASSFTGRGDVGEGTSFAAAAVSNLALLRSAEVDSLGKRLSGAELAAELMSACSPAGLDVRCGGALGAAP